MKFPIQRKKKNPGPEEGPCRCADPLPLPTTPSAPSIRCCIPPPLRVHSVRLSLAPFSLSADWWAAAAALSLVVSLLLVPSPATSTLQVLPPTPSLPFMPVRRLSNETLT